jgi:hypothetical protein
MNKFLVILLVSIFVSGCDSKVCENNIIDRQTSPDGKVDALIVERSCGATVGFSYAVHIVSKGVSTLETHIFLADHVEDLSISWLAEQHLIIGYKKARIFEYTNFWQSKNIDNFKYIIAVDEIKLRGAVSLDQSR